ncbi:hypothetical protein B0T22DRAFT_523034 [Podospora appendiculata]|uniref:Prion-inhibition and propagation HeLo domain-containing protein n=1 Tax=Podospora appendiculata TaxID=314037 RepID=A0AAE1C7P9_9PEZI|nr:hypothetical protein B0T22DRAFT_523034 [Podospora appendiculata]
MSGFEIAGLVLGAFPLAIAALDKYREVATRLGLFYKIRVEHKRCRDELEFHHLTFSRHLRQLLLPLVVDDAMIGKLLSAPGGESWNDPMISALLEVRLQESYELYLQYIHGIMRVMEELNRELAIDADSVQEKINTSREQNSGTRIKTAIGKEGRAFQRYRLKFCNGESVRKRLFGELQDYNNKLEKILDSSDRDARLVSQRASAADGAAIESAICNFWLQARRLFTALASSWSCHWHDHKADLLLEHRTSKKPEFQVMFTRFSATKRLWEIRRTKILEGREATSAMIQEGSLAQIEWSLEHERRPSHRHLQPAKSAFRTKKPAAGNIIEGVNPTASRLISDLCMALEPCRPEGSCCGYLSEEDTRYYVYTVSNQTSASLTSVTLDRILRGDVYPQPSRTQRYALALIMASKSEVVFLKDHSAAEPNVFLLDKPHIHRSLTCKKHNQPPAENAVKASRFADSLDQLGILLLKLCFGTTLEEQPCRKQWPVGTSETERAVFNVMAARDWQCHVNDEAGLDYADAVAWCLGGKRSTPDRWRQDMLRKVIQPLQRCRDYLVHAGAPLVE